MPTVISGTTGVSQVQDDIISTSKIIDSTITTLKIANNAVNTAQLSANSVTTDKVAIGAINIPYIHLIRSTGQTFAASSFTDIQFNSVVSSKNITYATNDYTLRFAIPGKYLFHIGFRYGIGGDVWTGIRVVDGIDNTTPYGVGGATGQTNSNDPAYYHSTIFVDIPSNRVNSPIKLQLYRHTSTLEVATPAFPSTSYFPAIQCTVQYLGQ
jgi:hypothetical protein